MRRQLGFLLLAALLCVNSSVKAAELSASSISGFLREALELAKPKKIKGIYFVANPLEPFWVMALHDTSVPRLVFLHPRGSFVVENWLPTSGDTGMARLRIPVANDSTVMVLVLFNQGVSTEVKAVRPIPLDSFNEEFFTPLATSLKGDELADVTCTRLFDIADEMQSKAKEKGKAEELSQWVQPCRSRTSTSGTVAALKKIKRQYSADSSGYLVFESDDKRKNALVKLPTEPTDGTTNPNIRYSVYLSNENYYLQTDISDLRYLFSFSSGKKMPRLAIFCGKTLVSYTAVEDENHKMELIKKLEAPETQKRLLLPFDYLSYVEKTRPAFVFHNRLTGELEFISSPYGPDYFSRSDTTPIDVRNIEMYKGSTTGAAMEKLYPRVVVKKGDVLQAKFDGGIILQFSKKGAGWKRGSEVLVELDPVPLEKTDVSDLLSKPSPLVKRLCDHFEKGLGQFY